MAKYFYPLPDAEKIARDVCLKELGRDPLVGVPQNIVADIDTTTPFLIGEDGSPFFIANRFMSARAHGHGIFDGYPPLAENSAIALGRDLEYFLTTYTDPKIGVLSDRERLLNHYRKHLRDSTSLSSSTIERRFGNARSFLNSMSTFPADSIDAAGFLEEKIFSRIRSDSNQQVNVYRRVAMTTGRRRHPSTLFLLPPTELVRFFAAFNTSALRASAKIIFSTGVRVSEVAGIRAGHIAKLKPIYPGGPASLRVLGKGDKERSIEVEPALLVGLKHYLTSKSRLVKAKIFARKYGCGPLDDEAPLLLNEFGDPLSANAITDGFRRASLRCEISRTPHELRHEFAVSYLINAYRNISIRVERAGFDAWLARLMIEGASSALLRLSHLLGHSSVETTKKDYMRLLVAADPSLRDAWCDHLDLVEASNL
jgi:integrase